MDGRRECNQDGDSLPVIDATQTAERVEFTRPVLGARLMGVTGRAAAGHVQIGVLPSGNDPLLLSGTPALRV